jgi:hypothetical protein
MIFLTQPSTILALAFLRKSGLCWFKIETVCIFVVFCASVHENDQLSVCEHVWLTQGLMSIFACVLVGVDIMPVHAMKVSRCR